MDYFIFSFLLLFFWWLFVFLGLFGVDIIRRRFGVLKFEGELVEVWISCILEVVGVLSCGFREVVWVLSVFWILVIGNWGIVFCLDIFVFFIIRGVVIGGLEFFFLGLEIIFWKLEKFILFFIIFLS